MEDSFFFSLSFFPPNVCIAVWFESVWFLGVIDFRIDLYDFFIFERIFFCGSRKNIYNYARENFSIASTFIVKLILYYSYYCKEYIICSFEIYFDWGKSKRKKIIKLRGIM